MYKIAEKADYQHLEVFGPWSLHKPWPPARCCWLVLLLYLIYLPLSGVDTLFWDSQQYWELATEFFTRQKSFSLLNFKNDLRGYVGPLLISPIRVVCLLLNWKPIYGAKFIGIVWATLLFGYTIPELWHTILKTKLPAKNWLLITGLGFVFWGDYFNYCLLDFPALITLLLSVLCLARPGLGWVFLGGMLLAMALNMRPIYLASLPGVVGWLGWQRRQADNTGTIAQWVGVGLCFLAGVTLVLLPQALINYRHFHHFTPLALATATGPMPFYLMQLNWGMAYQRYDSNINPLHYGGMLYSDPAGALQLAEQVKGYFDSYTSFLVYYIAHPVSSAARFLSHLFNGLDIDYRTPYPAKPVGEHITWLQLLNYPVLALGGGLLGYKSWQAVRYPSPRRPAVLWLSITLLLPVLLAVPTAIEVRFMLPLHLLLLIMVAANFQLVWQLQRRPATSLIFGLGLALVIWGGMQLSATMQKQLLPSEASPPDYTENY